MQTTLLKKSTVAAAAMAVVMMGGAGHAASITLEDSESCNTGSLKDCFVSANGLDRTEAIAKIEFGSDDNFEGNSNFSSVSLANFTFDVQRENDGTVTSGTATYTLGNDSDPGMTAFSTKRGNNDPELFFGDAIVFESGVFTFDFGSGQNAVSNFVIYDNFGDTPVIPLPAAGWLLLAGIGGLAAFRRRKSV